MIYMTNRKTKLFFSNWIFDRYYHIFNIDIIYVNPCFQSMKFTFSTINSLKFWHWFSWYIYLLYFFFFLLLSSERLLLKYMYILPFFHYSLRQLFLLFLYYHLNDIDFSYCSFVFYHKIWSLHCYNHTTPKSILYFFF